MYQLKAVINGIESGFSGIITINDSSLTVSSSLAEILQYIVIYALVFILAATNMPYSEWYWSVIGILSCGFGAYLTFITNHTTFYLILMVSIYGATGGFLFFILIFTLIKYCARNRTHFKLRENAFKKYTIRIFERSPGEFNVKINPNLLKDPKEEIVRLELEMKERQKWGLCQRTGFKFCKMAREFWQCLIPFELFARQDNPGDAFYYPQRLLTPMFISTLSILYLTYSMYLFFFEAKDVYYAY